MFIKVTAIRLPRGMRSLLSALAVIGIVTGAGTVSSFALSEIPEEKVPAPPASDDTIQKEPLPPVGEVPAPDPIQTTPPAETTPPGEVEPGEPNPESEEPGDEAAPGDDETSPPGRPEVDPNAPLPEIIYDLEKLPAPAKRMRELIMQAAKSGDIEALRVLIGVGADITQLSLGGIEGDPIEFLKELSGDKEGHEILAILEEVLDAGYVHLDAGKPEELYVWPYFFAIPLERLTPPQRVEMFKIVTAGDYEDMKTYGAYIFYRVGITPEGRWSFFVAGD